LNFVVHFVLKRGFVQEVTEKRGRGGRPPAGSESDVERRLLAAATRLFLERGYDGTSCDQVALDARAGKASIYARYANKEALFAAVIATMLGRSPAQDDVDASAPVHARLAAVGLRVVADALHPDAIALLRLVLAQLPRFAQSGVRADELFWQPGVRRVATAIAGLAAGALDRAIGPAQQFVELVVMPPVMRALMGEDSAPFVAAAPARIGSAITLLAAEGKLAGWD